MKEQYMEVKELPGRIRDCPKPFYFTTPEDKRVEGGTVHQEELVEHLEGEERDYYKVVQLLEWRDDGWSVRLGYYLRPHGTSDENWTWGSQTTSVISIEYIGKLIDTLSGLKKTYEKMQGK
jgi:hypothetical protein